MEAVDKSCVKATIVKCFPARRFLMFVRSDPHQNWPYLKFNPLSFFFIYFFIIYTKFLGHNQWILKIKFQWKFIDNTGVIYPLFFSRLIERVPVVSRIFCTGNVLLEDPDCPYFCNWSIRICPLFLTGGLVHNTCLSLYFVCVC